MLCVRCVPSIGYAIVTLDAVRLYMSPEKLTDDVLAHIGPSVIVQPYEAVFTDLTTLTQAVTVGGGVGSDASKGKVWLDTASTSWAIATVRSSCVS